MEIPNKIKYIFERIDSSEKEWKALYMAVWHYAYYIDAEFINKKENKLKGQDFFVAARTSVVINSPAAGTASAHIVNLIPNKEIITLALPASKSGFYEWKPQELYSILSSRDGQFTIGHLQTLFSLFEELLYETAKELYNLEINTSKWVKMVKFFNLENFNNIVSAAEINELKLAKETRNCFIHNGSKIDDFWLSAYNGSRGNLSIDLRGKKLSEGFTNIFYEIENWHNLIISISNKIKEKILEMS